MPSSDCRLIFIYCFGNPNVTLTGIYSFDREECQLKTRIRQADFDIAFGKITNGECNLVWDANQEIIWVVNRFKLIPNKSAKVMAGLIDELNIITHPFRTKFIEKYKEDISGYLWRLKGHKMDKEEMLTEDFILNASKIYTSKASLKNFMLNRGIAEQKIDEVIVRILPNMKP